MKLYFDLIVIGIAVQVATNMPNAVADVPEKFDAKFVTPNQHVYTGEYHLVMPEPGVPGGGHLPHQYCADQLTLFILGEGRSSPPITTAPQFLHLPASLPYGSQANNMKLPYTKYVSLNLTQT